ncbi:MAG: MAPEG family protein [Pseudomonadota bacterium]
MAIPEISIVAAAVLIALQMGLMLSVGLHRAVVKIGVGHGEDEALHRKIRRHANLAENSALFLVALALAEIAGASLTYVGIVAAIFVAARVSHALAFTSSTGSHAPDGSMIFPAMRAFGAFGTIGSSLGVAALLVGLLV